MSTSIRALRHLILLVPFTAAVMIGAEPNAVTLTDALRDELALPLGVPIELVTVATSKDEKYTDEQARKNASDIIRFEACHVGQQRVLFKITFARRPVFDNGGLILYADLDGNLQTGRQDCREHRGVDVMISVSGTQLSLGIHNASFSRHNTRVTAAKIVGEVLYLTLDAPLKIEQGKVLLDLSLLCERKDGGRSDSTPRRVVTVPCFPDRQVPKVADRGVPDLRPLSDYRYHDNFAKYEKLADKGLKFETVKPIRPIEIGRPRPAVPFAAAARKPGQPGSVKARRVAIQLLEEAGVARSRTAVCFGFPLPQGAVFDPGHLRMLSPSGPEVPAQFTATSFWPDDSLKWVLVDFTASLAAKEAADYSIEFGSDVRRGPDESRLKIQESGAALVVTTGPLKVEIDKKRFNLFRGVWIHGQSTVASAPEGVRLVDEQGKLFTTSGREPDSVKIEEQGPRKAVVRVEGAYASPDGQTYMRYIARLIFHAGSPYVGVTFTHVNDYLKTEFTDITSLSLPMVPTGGIARTTLHPSDKDGSLAANEGHVVSLFQMDERTCAIDVDGRKSQDGPAQGVVRCSTSRGAFSAAVHDFWQRWPKGLSADAHELRIEFLPKQPGAGYGRGLPHYLLYPFVEGFYRFKWGMSFTERMTFDFSGVASPAEILAEANWPIVAVVPAGWYAQTKALGPLASPRGEQFALWDKYVASGYENFVRRQVQDRAFGYFNYGDWYGERGRNWGNNEYDFAHGYFLQFARTGNRDYFRVALCAARHQADVDCVQAYPDPYNLGANHPHSIGHTGDWSEQPTYGTWSYRYGGMTSASNGHTWASGMVDAWHLAGEARIMESAIGVGEQIVWAMAPKFKSLGTHERSAGWSLKAILSIYHSTYDPLYLEAARHIAAVALREQKFDDGGAWPHLLPDDHAGGRPNARGNAIFLMGVLLEGLKEYHEETQDPAAARSLKAGAQWLLKCWDPNVEGWPYTAMVSGEPLFTPSTSPNALVISSLAYVGLLTGEQRFVDIAQTGLGAMVRRGASADGKSIAGQMNFTSDTLALLQQWYATHRPDHGIGVLTGSGADLAEYLAKTRDADEHRVRDPLRKIFTVRFLQPAATQRDRPILTAVRKPHGAMVKRAEFGTIQVFDASDKEVKHGRFNTDDPYRFECPLEGRPGAEFKVVVTDDLRSVWSLKGDGLGILMHTSADFSIGLAGRGRYHFLVPEGTKEFQVKLRAGHQGAYAGVVISPSGKIAGFHQGVHSDRPSAVSGSKTRTAPRHERPERGVIQVKPDPQDTGKVWSLVLMAAGDIYCDLQGVPPYLSLSPGALAGYSVRD